MDAKYDPELEIDATNWIEQVLGERVFGDEHGSDNTQAVLKSGVVLCRYVFYTYGYSEIPVKRYAKGAVKLYR